MQQVARSAKFWWRADDAPPLNAPVSQATYLWPHRIEQQPAASQLPRPSLAIARDERRLRTQRRRVSRKLRVAAVSAALISMATAGLVAIKSDALASIDVAHALSAKSRELLVVTGFGIDQVTVSGQRFALDTDIFDALDLPNVRTFADLDMAAVRKRIERISWVKSAQITRDYPSTLAIVIAERTPAVIWRRAGSDYLVDATGRVLGPVPKAVAWKLPVVAGEGAASEAPMLLTALSRYPQVLNEMDYCERIAERRWRIVYRNGSIIELAAEREAEGLDRVLQRAEARRALEAGATVADVRTPGRIALRPVVASALSPDGRR